jgi:transposase
VIRHEPENTQCACGCQLRRIGEDLSEKLDCMPGVFTVEHHVRGKCACCQCEALIQAPVPAQVTDKGIPTVGLLAHVMAAKFADYLPLYRQENIRASRFGDSPFDTSSMDRTTASGVNQRSNRHGRGHDDAP